MNNKRIVSTTLASLVLLAGMAAATVFAAEPEEIIKYRKNVMKANGGHMAASAAIVTGKVGYQGDLAEHARALAAINKDVAALFPKDSDFGDTDALDAVWSKNAEFKKRAGDAKAKSEAFVKAVASRDQSKIAAGFKDLNDACKACHKDFRKEKN
jgi:cytochrome c556